VELLRNAALGPVLEGGGGEHAPRCHLNLYAEAVSEERGLRAEAARARSRAAAVAAAFAVALQS
jgi:hypothetical protein